MKTQTIIEIIGYAGSFLVLVSFLMTSVAKLRIVNTIGSIIFMIYALIIKSYPTAVMNFCLVLINLHFLWKMRHTGNEYELIEVSPNDLYLQHILENKKDDIEKCFPGMCQRMEDLAASVNRAYIIGCNGSPVGITLAKVFEEAESKAFDGSPYETMYLVLDYSIPEYRDFSIGNFMMKALKQQGVDRLIYDGPAEHHQLYLSKMGFKKQGEMYVKDL